jgi:hypothetical protein
MRIGTFQEEANMDFVSSVRGSLGQGLEDLVLGSNLGNLAFMLNGAFFVLLGVCACLLVAKSRRVSSKAHQHHLKLSVSRFW